MAKVNFYYDFKKDAWSWVYFAKRKSDMWGLKQRLDFIPKNLLKEIRKKNRKPAETFINNYLVNHPKKQIRRIIIKQEIDVLRDTWRKLEGKFFKKLEKITQKPIFTGSFKCYSTSGFSCPYSEKENWFMISIWHSLPSSITTICHEIIHLQFLHYYRKYCRKFLSEEKLQDLKEALTFMLNTDFDDLILVEDNGYPNHRKLRKKLKQEWKKEKDFHKFLDKAIKIVKNDKK